MKPIPARPRKKTAMRRKLAAFVLRIGRKRTNSMKSDEALLRKLSKTYAKSADVRMLLYPTQENKEKWKQNFGDSAYYKRIADNIRKEARRREWKYKRLAGKIAGKK